MGVLRELGLEGPGGLMLVAPPDSVFAEAARLTPRPAIASSIMTAEPTARLVWWPDAQSSTAGTLARLAWLLTANGCEAWVVLDVQEETAGVDVFRVMAETVGLSVAETRIVSGLESALRFVAQTLET